MVGTIRPVVYRDRQLLRWSIAANLHILANTIASVVVGAILGLFGSWLLPNGTGQSTLLFGGLSLLSIAYALDDLNILRLPYPQRIGQVPASWRIAFHPYITALLYGLGLGTGIATSIVTGAVYIALSGSFLSASPLYGAMIFGFFGFGRGVSVLIAGWFMRNLRSGTEVHPAFQWLMQQENRVHFLGGMLLLSLGSFWMICLLMLN